MSVILAVVWTHFFADFICQSDYMAQNKSKNSLILLYHVAVYQLPFSILFGLKYGLLNMAAHFLTDFITSRITSRLWSQKKVHWFFVVIGFDQAVHITTLILTLRFAHIIK